jgi:Collagen triple helix repeat (20 copies).
MFKILGNTQGSLKWLIIACLLAVALGVGFIGLNQWSTTQDKYVAQANAETLARDINTVCIAEGKLMVNSRDLCTKGEDVLANPTEAIPGPKGEAGTDGHDGLDGTNGTNGVDGQPGTNGVDGKDSVVPGPNGLNGADGINGTNGTDGTDGVDGTNGTDGTDGIDGKDGQSVTYFSWYEPKTGQKYNCVPDPPGSSTFTCTAEPTVKTAP